MSPGMLQNAADEVLAEIAERLFGIRVVHQIGDGCRVPHAQMHVGAAAERPRERLGREAGAVAVLERHAANRVAQLGLLVGREQRRRVVDRDLFLAGPALVDDHLGLHAYGAQGASDVGQEFGLDVEPGLGVDASVVGRFPLTGLGVSDAKIKLRLKTLPGCAGRALPPGRLCLSETCADTRRSGCRPCRPDRSTARVRWRPRQHGQRVRVGQHA